MRNSFLLFPALFLSLLQPAQLSAQTVDCDTVPVVAQATGGFITCLDYSATLTGALHPSALSYHWTGPGGLNSADRVVEWYTPGTYILTVTGKYGCTAQTTATIADSCTFFPLVPPECPDPFLPATDDCGAICVRPFLPKNFWFSNADAQPDGDINDSCAIEIHNNQWFAFVASATAGTIIAESANCADGNGIQLALLDACGGTVLACNGGLNGGAGQLINLNVDSLIIGKVYYLMVDGFIGDRCDYRFIFDGGVCDGVPPSPGTPALSGPSKVCPEAVAEYRIAPAPFATAYLWTAPPGSLINGMPSPVVLYTPNGTSVTIKFGNQPGAVTVRALNYFRPPSPPLVIPITMQPIPPTFLPTLKVCYEDLPFIWEEDPFTILGAPGTYDLVSTPYQNYLGCDSVVRQRIIIAPPKVSNIGTKVVCAGNCFNINGNDFCTSGFYSEVLESYEGCDSIVNFSLIVLNPVAEITGGGTLTCTTTAIPLGSAPSNNSFKQWRNGFGQVLATGNTLTVTQPGMYVLTTTATASGVVCAQSDTIVIVQDIFPVQVMAGDDKALTCANPTIHLSGSAIPGFAALKWSGPNGFSSTQPDPEVSVPGVYTLTATNPANGCTGTDSVVVNMDQTAPVTAAAGGTITCLQTSVTLSGATNDPEATYEWTGPNGFNSTLLDPETKTPGTYTLTVTGANGCTGMATAEVIADQQSPAVTASGGTLTCTATEYALQATADLPPASYLWEGPNGFLSTESSPAVATPGTYTITVTAANGCTGTATAEVVADQQSPSVTAGAGTLTCIKPETTLQATADLPSASYLWEGPNGFVSTESSPAVATPGTYTITVTAANGCTGTATAEVNADQQSFAVTASGGTLTCAVTEIALQATADLPPVSYLWQGPNGFLSTESSPAVAAPGSYTITVTAANGCTGTATAEVDADQQLPTVTASGGTLTCAVTEIALQATADLPPASYLWEGPNGFVSTESSPAAAAPGTYTITVTAANGCTGTATAEVNADQQSLAVTASGGTLTCTVTEIALQATADLPPAGFLWTGPNGFESSEVNPAVDSPGVYTLTVTASNGCTGSATATVFADQIAPDVIAASDTLNCDEPAAGLYATTNAENALFFWTGPGGFQSDLQNPEAPQAGLYLLTVTNTINGCTAQAQTTVVADLNVPGIDVIQIPPVCGDSLLFLDASSPFPGAQFFWTGPNGFKAYTEDVQVTEADWYRVKATAPNGCSSEIQILAVPAPPVPQVSIFPPDPVLTCATPVITLSAAADVAGCTFVWSTPGNGPVSAPGVYQVTATTPDGCTGTAQATVAMDANIPDLSAEGGVLTCEQPTTLLTAFSSTPGAIITWYGPGFPGNQNPVLVSGPGQYTAVATAPNGCTSSITVTVVDSCQISAAKEPRTGKDIVIYPNPGKGMVWVKSLSGQPVDAVVLYRMDGAWVRQETPAAGSSIVQLDWRELPAGVYTISVLTENNWVNKRLILLE